MHLITLKGQGQNLTSVQGHVVIQVRTPRSIHWRQLDLRIGYWRRKESRTSTITDTITENEKPHLGVPWRAFEPMLPDAFGQEQLPPPCK